MNIMNKLVTHENFGEGSIVKQGNTVVEIQFEMGNKKFLFPDAFTSHLTLLDQNSACSMKKLIQRNEVKLKQEELENEKIKRIQRQELERIFEIKRLMKSNKFHLSSQAVFWCDEEDQNRLFTEWTVSTGIIKSGIKKGQPNRPIRMHQNSACLLTERNSKMPEQDRKIIGLYMVHEMFTGKQCEDGHIPAHSEFRLRLSEEESKKMLFWNYFANERYPQNTTWNTGIYRYFENICMAQILRDIASLKKDSAEKEIAQNFYKHFCRINKIDKSKLPVPNGTLMRIENSAVEAIV